MWEGVVCFAPHYLRDLLDFPSTYSATLENFTDVLPAVFLSYLHLWMYKYILVIESLHNDVLNCSGSNQPLQLSAWAALTGVSSQRMLWVTDGELSLRRAFVSTGARAESLLSQG